ncbi:MAG: Protein translocase subunit SecA, preprotein translocase subunit SecA [Parcubacteria group bacterium]|nr:Protein translocase subunit SecA, preprotein translocase subunit SecA [Parcubacteria group bacterium]
MGLFGSLFTGPEEKKLRSWGPLVAQINSFEEPYSKLSSAEMKGKTAEFKERLAKGASLDDLLAEAFAAVREASKRTLGQRHFDVQLLGGIAMHKGGIAEMRTGEGKTLVATLPAYLNALTGSGVHVVTVNDYLSRRDAVWMGQIYSYLGLSVGVLNHAASFLYDPAHISQGESADEERDETGSFHVVHEFLRPATKQEAYRADITYGTNNEFGFDYLRDNLIYRRQDLSQREFAFAIVDEIDSILIDEARTPLIISSNTGAAGDLYGKFAAVAEKMIPEEDFVVDEKLKSISLTDAGITKAESILGLENIYTEGGVKYVHHLETAVRAKALFHKDDEYVVKDGEVLIVDEFTGRIQPGRRWSEGLHQAIEAKEGVNIKEESRTFASITFQNYFRMYKKLAGMTGTAMTSKEEFYKVYGLEVYVIPTNKSVARIDHNDLIFQTQAGKMKAVAKKVKEVNEGGQPVLIGTVSIENNELLSQYLTGEGIKHEILNAKNASVYEREGEIIAQAGKRGAVTIATNMAGRGVDIKLGGNPGTPESQEEIRSLGGLFVLGTERHDARRIDNQLRGRSGRQGDPGETQFFVSLEDSLMRIFATDAIKTMMGRFNIPEDEAIENKLITNSLEKAQEKIEGFNFDARKHVLEFDDVLNYQRSIIYNRRRGILTGGKAEIDAYLDEVISLVDEGTAGKIEAKREALEKPEIAEALQRVILQTIDMFWVDHLEMMDYLRNSVNLRAYGQRDPLVEYKREGLQYFKNMESSIARQVGEFLAVLEPEAFSGVRATTIELDAAAVADTLRSMPGEMIGRNDPCPCGAVNPETGKSYKYKQCGLINAPHHKG